MKNQEVSYRYRNRSKTTAIVCLLFILFLQTAARAQQDINTFYVFDGKNLTKVERGDPNEIKVVEWQVWLYKAGKSTTDKRNHWGTISSRTAAGVMAKLKNEQDFELRYNAWAGRGRVPDEVLTNFNPVGPIAIVERTSQAQTSKDAQRLIPKETWDRMQSTFERAGEYYEGYQNIAEILSKEPKTQTPFDNVGNVLREYRDNLQDAMAKVAQLRQMLEETTSPALNDLYRSLDELTRQLDSVQVSARRVSQGFGISESVLIPSQPPRGNENPIPTTRITDTIDAETERLLKEFENIDPTDPDATMRRVNQIARELARTINADPESTPDMKELAKLLVELTGTSDLEQLSEKIERLTTLIERIKP